MCVSTQIRRVFCSIAGNVMRDAFRSRVPNSNYWTRISLSCCVLLFVALAKPTYCRISPSCWASGVVVALAFYACCLHMLAAVKTVVTLHYRCSLWNSQKSDCKPNDTSKEDWEIYKKIYWKKRDSIESPTHNIITNIVGKTNDDEDRQSSQGRENDLFYLLYLCVKLVPFILIKLYTSCIYSEKGNRFYTI